jgi:hypothetical protein
VILRERIQWFFYSIGLCHGVNKALIFGTDDFHHRGAFEILYDLDGKRLVWIRSQFVVGFIERAASRRMIPF